MRDEGLLHFHVGEKIAPGVHVRMNGAEMADLLGKAAPWLDPASPGRSLAGFCAVHTHLVEEITPPPPQGWPQWGFAHWDQWFGRLHGVFLADLGQLRLRQFPLWSCGANRVDCDFSALPGKITQLHPLRAGQCS